MKRYLLFAGRDYEEAGGWRDFVCAADDLADLFEAAADPATYAHGEWTHEGRLPEWWHIVDASDQAGSIVHKGRARDLCRHARTRTVWETVPGPNGPLASGQNLLPGTYCLDCGTHLGNSPPTIDEGPTVRIT